MTRKQAYAERVKDRQRRRLTDALTLRWTHYIPHSPTPKQRVFLGLPHREAFYGGAAGGGKSDALLMGALQHVDVPSYSAIIFRKTIEDAFRRDSIGDRLIQWLSDFPEVERRGNKWWFPTASAPATIEIAGLRDELTKYKYQGAQYQYIAFDELTQFWASDYLYLRSRNRRPRCPYHGGRVTDGVPDPLPDDPGCPSCIEFAELSRVPLRVRAAANPGGVGHRWVKQRFDIGPWVIGHDKRGEPIHQLDDKGNIRYVGRHKSRPFIPALVWDNPYLDQREYADALEELDPVTRAQLKHGDWSSSTDGRIKARWISRFTYDQVSRTVTLIGRNKPPINLRSCRIYLVADLAASSREGPGDAQIYVNREPSWTVIGTFALTPCGNLLWIDMLRFQRELPAVYKGIKQQFHRCRELFRVTPSFIAVDANGLGVGILQALEQAGAPVHPMYASADKLIRATDSIRRAERGRFFLPEQAPWLSDLEDELFTWTGHPHEQADQIDVFGMAGTVATEIFLDKIPERFLDPTERNPLDPDLGKESFLDRPSVI